jgi:peptidoglycan LD-endopeptidase LytH
MNNLEKILKKNKNLFRNVISTQQGKSYTTDLSKNNPEMKKIDCGKVATFSRYIFDKLEKQGSEFGIGKYNEDRVIYDHSNVFDGQEKRTIHLGIDLWVQPKTNVYAPLDAVVHSFNNNAANGDYGPTIILEHKLNDTIFHTLYGHLSLDSLENIYEGMTVKAGTTFARVGNYPINGNWPPHLHFQIIKNILGKKGDFPGVCGDKDRAYFLDLCPDPNLILF